MCSKLAFGFLSAALAAGSALPAVGAVERMHFTLTSIGNADFDAAVPVKEGDHRLAKLRSTEYGRAILQSPDFFLGEMKDLWQVFEFSVGGEKSDYEIRIRFSDPSVVKSEVTDGYGRKSTKAEVLLVMNATVAGKDGKIAFSGNFERRADKDENGDPTLRLMRCCFSDFAVSLRMQFAASYRVNIRKPASFPEFDPASVIIRVDGDRVNPETDMWLSKGRHELKVTADGCEDVVSTVEVTDHLQSSVKLKRK